MGCSWLELLIDFGLATGKTVRRAENLLRDGAGLLRREGALAETIRLFQAETIAQVRDRFTLGTRELFRPCKGRPRVSILGVRTNAACFQAWPAWGNAKHIQVLCLILAQRGIHKGQAKADSRTAPC